MRSIIIVFISTAIVFIPSMKYCDMPVASNNYYRTTPTRLFALVTTHFIRFFFLNNGNILNNQNNFCRLNEIFKNSLTHGENDIVSWNSCPYLEITCLKNCFGLGGAIGNAPARQTGDSRSSNVDHQSSHSNLFCFLFVFPNSCCFNN